MKKEFIFGTISIFVFFGMSIFGGDYGVLNKNGQYLIYDDVAVVEKNMGSFGVPDDCTKLINEVTSDYHLKKINSCIDKNDENCTNFSSLLKNKLYIFGEKKPYSFTLLWPTRYRMILPENAERVKRDFADKNGVDLKNVTVLWDPSMASFSWRMSKIKDDQKINLLKKFMAIKYPEYDKNMYINESGTIVINSHIDRCALEMGNYVVEGSAQVEVISSGNVSDEVINKLNEIHQKIKDLKVTGNYLKAIVVGSYFAHYFKELVQEDKDIVANMTAIYLALFYNGTLQLRPSIDIDAYRKQMKIEQETIMFDAKLGTILQ